MKREFKLIAVFILSILVSDCFAQKRDTLEIHSKDLRKKNIRLGNLTYLVYNKKSKGSPAERNMIVKISVKSVAHNGIPVFAITQQWERDTVVHSAYTILRTNDFSTLQHNFFWKRLGYSAKYDFESKKVSFEGNVSDSIKLKSVKDFNESFVDYNLNWHSDLIIFPLLPFKKGRTFKINFFDPGFGKTQTVLFDVVGSEIFDNHFGAKINCWVLEHKLAPMTGYQRFWISMNTNEVLKEEDLFNGQYRFKLKLLIPENN